ncbi:hypothetical protein [Ralstonia solanacearum]|nr:hypothetical protein [Ralstonia solanacearum]
MNTSPQHPQEIIHIGNNNFSEPLSVVFTQPSQAWRKTPESDS